MVDTKMKISFVIPCYGSEKTIESVVNGIIETVKQGEDSKTIPVYAHLLEVMLQNNFNISFHKPNLIVVYMTLSYYSKKMFILHLMDKHTINQKTYILFMSISNYTVHFVTKHLYNYQNYCSYLINQNNNKAIHNMDFIFLVYSNTHMNHHYKNNNNYHIYYISNESLFLQMYMQKIK